MDNPKKARVQPKTTVEENRQPLEEALAEGEARMRVMMDTAPDGIFTIGTNHELETASNVLHHMFGYEKDELIGKNIHVILPAFSSENEYTSDKLQTWQGQIYSFGRELTGRCKDGSEINVELSTSVLNLSDRQIITGIVRDTTERKKSEQRLLIQYTITRVLEQSESLEIAAPGVVEALCQAYPWEAASIWSINESELHPTAIKQSSKSDLAEFNKKAQEFTFIRGKGVLGTVWQKNKPIWVTGDDFTYDDELLNLARKHGLNSTFAFPIRGSDKVLGVLQLFSSKNCQPQWELFQMLESLSSQVGQFIERKVTEKRLRESEKLFRQLMENIKEISWISNVGADQFFYLSPAYEQLTGRPCSEVYQRASAFLDDFSPKDKERANAHLKAAQTSADGTGAEYKIVTKSGVTKWIYARIFPIADEHGNLVRMCGIAHDITERKEAETRVRDFYSTVSHELRTPLTSIRGSLGLIEGGLAGNVSDKAKQFVHIARSESDRLIRLINDILDIRKIEAGKLELKLGYITDNELVNTVFQSMASVAEQAGITLESSVDGNTQLYCDKDRITQVLTNLLSNAIKFSPTGAKVEVQVKAMSSTSCRFSIIDHGPGIPKEQMHKLFGFFQQLDSSGSRKAGGSGLGLAISKAIVEQHNGIIGLESEVGKGSTFWFELPTTSQMLKPTITGRMRALKGGISGGHKSKHPRVLLIEDDQSSRKLLRHQLRSLNLEYVECTDGQSALNIIPAEHFDLIILDVNIPPPDGFALVKELRRKKQTDLPLLVYTSRDLLKSDRKKLTLGETKHLIKSRTTPNQLVEAVCQLLKIELSPFHTKVKMLQ